MFKYFDELSKIFKKMEVTDNKGRCIDISTGLKKAVDLVKKTHDVGHTVMLIGNGGSASIASHIAIDFWKNSGIKAACFNDTAQLTCLSNDFGYEYVFEKPIDFFATPGDTLIAISSSGKSVNILKGVNAARAGKCSIVTMSGFKKDNPLKKMGDLNFYVPSDSYGFVEIAHCAVCHLIADYTLDYGHIPHR